MARTTSHLASPSWCHPSHLASPSWCHPSHLASPSWCHPCLLTTHALVVTSTTYNSLRVVCVVTLTTLYKSISCGTTRSVGQCIAEAVSAEQLHLPTVQGSGNTYICLVFSTLQLHLITYVVSLVSFTSFPQYQSHVPAPTLTLLLLCNLSIVQ